MPTMEEYAEARAELVKISEEIRHAANNLKRTGEALSNDPIQAKFVDIGPDRRTDKRGYGYFDLFGGEWLTAEGLNDKLRALRAANDKVHAIWQSLTDAQRGSLNGPPKLGSSKY